MRLREDEGRFNHSVESERLSNVSHDSEPLLTLLQPGPQFSRPNIQLPSYPIRRPRIDRYPRHPQVIVPCTMEPFLSSIVTVSLLSFIKNLRC